MKQETRKKMEELQPKMEKEWISGAHPAPGREPRSHSELYNIKEAFLVALHELPSCFQSSSLPDVSEAPRVRIDFPPPAGPILNPIFTRMS